MFTHAEEKANVATFNFMDLMGMNRKDEEVYSEHPDYTVRKKAFSVAYDAYHGTGQFLDASGIEQFSDREEADFHSDRKSQAYYLNIMKNLINFPVNTIFSGEFERPNLTDLYNVSTAHVGGWEAFWKLATYEARRDGVALVMVDRDNDNPVTNEQERRENPARLHLIPAINFVDWKIEGNVFKWVKVIEEDPTSRENPIKPGAFIPRLRVWTPNESMVFRLDDEGKWTFAFSVPNEFGVVPIIPLYAGKPDNNSIYGDTTGLQLGFISRRLYNQNNETDNQLRQSAFNQLCYPSPDGEPQDGVVGEGVILWYDPALGGGAPTYVAPSPDPVDVCMRREEQLEKAMYRTMSIDPELMKLPTATQQHYISEAAARSIRELAFYGQMAELWAIELLLEVEYGAALKPEDEVKWPKDYSQQVLSDNFVAKVIQLLSINWPSETARKEFAKFFSTHLIPLRESERDKILAEIEASDGVTSFALANQTKLSGEEPNE